MTILANICYFDIISWLPHGRGFLIHNKKKFASEVLPLYFAKDLQYASFSRRLTRWGFRRIKKGHDIGVYHNPLFRKDNPKLCLKMHCTIKSPKNDLSDPAFYTEDDNTLYYLHDEDSSQEASRRMVMGHGDLQNTILQNKKTTTKNSKIDIMPSTYPSPFPLPNTGASTSAVVGNTTPFSSSTVINSSQDTRNDLFDDSTLLNTTNKTTNSFVVPGPMAASSIQLSQSTKSTAQTSSTSSATISSSRILNAHRQLLVFPPSSTSTATLFETPSNKATSKMLPTTTSASTVVIRPDFCSSSLLLHPQIQQQPLLVVRQQMISFPPAAYSSNPTTRRGGRTIITPQETLTSLPQQTIPLLNLQQPTMLVQPKHYLSCLSPNATTLLVMSQHQEPTILNHFHSVDVIRNQHGPPLSPDQIFPPLVSAYDITSTTGPHLSHVCSNADISEQEQKLHM